MRDYDLIKERISYCPDSGNLYWKKTHLTQNEKEGDLAGGRCNHGYITLKCNGVSYQGHRVAYFLMTGDLPYSVDHINGDKTDNRWVNLRAASHSENIVNQGFRKTNKSGIKNVYWNKAKEGWSVAIRSNGKRHNLGTFDTIFEAAAVAIPARTRLHGVFANHG